MVLGDAYIGDDGAVALDDVRTVVALQHHVQVHQNPLVLVFVPRAAHLLETHRRETRVTLEPFGEIQA